MTESNVYIIFTAPLFHVLNAKRKNNALPEIENALIASKQGILFTLRTHNYINFKGDQVAFNDDQLLELQEIIKQHFNVDMTTEILSLMITQEKRQEKRAAHTRHPMSQLQTNSKGLFNKIKFFFKINTGVREDMA
jgi:hypothetical protein